MIRDCAVAGSFYPAEPNVLKQMLNNFFKPVADNKIAAKALIAPHAGFIYSGSIAASAYSCVLPVRDLITRVVLIGPSHRFAFQGLATSSADIFTTPLGEINIDQSAIRSLLAFPFVKALDQAHTLEHSLETQLPFLQQVLPKFMLIPILVSNASAEQVSQVLDSLWGGPETLIVVSSDLSHYHDYLTAQRLDRHTSDMIEQLDYLNLTQDAACGMTAISGLLKLLKQKSLTIKTLDIRNSGDTAGDKKRVVGYGAYVVERN